MSVGHGGIGLRWMEFTHRGADVAVLFHPVLLESVVIGSYPVRFYSGSVPRVGQPACVAHVSASLPYHFMI